MFCVCVCVRESVSMSLCGTDLAIFTLFSKTKEDCGIASLIRPPYSHPLKDAGRSMSLLAMEAAIFPLFISQSTVP